MLFCLFSLSLLVNAAKTAKNIDLSLGLGYFSGKRELQ